MCGAELQRAAVLHPRGPVWVWRGRLWRSWWRGEAWRPRRLPGRACVRLWSGRGPLWQWWPVQCEGPGHWLEMSPVKLIWSLTQDIKNPYLWRKEIIKSLILQFLKQRHCCIYGDNQALQFKDLNLKTKYIKCETTFWKGISSKRFFSGADGPVINILMQNNNIGWPIITKL